MENDAALAERIKRTSWYRKGFEGTAYALYPWQDFLRVQRGRRFPARFHEALTVMTGTTVEWFWNERDLAAIRRWFIRSIERDAAFPRKIVARWQRLIAPVDRQLNRLGEVNLRRLDDVALVACRRRWYEPYLEAAAVAALNEGFSLNADRWLGDMLTAFLRPLGQTDRFREYFSTLTQTTHPSFIQAAASAKARGLRPTALARRFYWIHFNYLHTRPLTARYFARWPGNAAPNFRAVAREKRRLVAQLNLPPLLRRLFAAADLFTWWQDQRKQRALITTYWEYKFLREAGRRRRVPDRQLRHMVPPEFPKLVSGDPEFLEGLSRRRDPLLVYVGASGRPTVRSGRRAEAIVSALDQPLAVGEVRGTPTYLGVARGRVIIIRGVADMRRVRRGDILVTSMTRPEYTPVLGKAGGIVTDEGGITSHAAIVSREFQIPCVIATKVATRVFHDGDRVEVDATTGVVRQV